MLIRQYTTDTTLEKKWDVGFGNGGVIVFTLVEVNSHSKMSHFIFLFLSLFFLLFFCCLHTVALLCLPHSFHVFSLSSFLNFYSIAV